MRSALLLTSLLVSLLAPFASAQQEPEIRGIWVDSWNSGIHTADQIDQLIADTQRGNLNAIFAQVRRRGDAFYDSNYEPKVNSGSFDSLAYLIEKAHASNPPIEVHAWIIAYPLGSSSSHSDHILNKFPDWLMENRSGEKLFNNQYWADPAHPGVQEHTFNVAMDIISRYDVDGFHFDYIRYPSRDSGYNPVSVERFNERFGRTGSPSTTDSQWLQFRRDAVTELVRRIYLEAMDLKPGIKISAATIGQAPGITSTSEWSNSSAYASRLQDWRAWMEEGILDLNIPMLYFNQDDWPEAWSRWNTFSKNHKYNRHLAIGAGWYINNISDTFDQIDDTRQTTSAGNRAEGSVGYHYYRTNTQNVSRTNFLNSLSNASGPFPQNVPTPEMPWKVNPTQGHAKGIIMADDSGQPLENARVELSGPHERTLRTDAHGFYGGVDLPPGSYTVTASLPNAPYDPETRTAAINAGNVTTTDFALEFAPAAEVVIDNPDALFWGDWTAPTTSDFQYGDDYRLAWPVEEEATATATYRPNISISGTYDIDVWYISGGNRSPDVPYEIVDSLGETTVEFDQRTGGGQWQRLASEVHFSLGTEGYVQVANNASCCVVTTDAVRFTLAEADPDPTLFFEEPVVHAGSKSAIVTWETAGPATVEVAYGLSQQTTALSGETSETLTEHSVPLDNLEAGRQYHARLHAQDDERSYVSNWFTFETNESVEVTVDTTDSESTFSSGWTISSSNGGWNTYRFASTVAGSPTSQATYRPNLPVTGNYDVSVYYLASSNRATNSPHLISYEGGSESVAVNQQAHSQQWFPIAEDRPFSAGTSGFVRISNNTGSSGLNVIADGVRWTLRDSLPSHSMTSNVTGSGTVAQNPGDETHEHGATVELAATAEPGWVFDRWEGDVESDETPISMTLYRDREVTAIFHQLFELTSQVSGEGSVELFPDEELYPNETEVEARAIPADGWTFLGWTGDQPGPDNPALVWMDDDKTLVANFGFSYSTWAETTFSPDRLEDPDFTHPTADPLGHGIPNILKYAFAMDLHQPDRSRLPSTTIEGERLRLSFTRLRGEAGIVYEVETSSDLATWQPADGEFSEISVEKDPDGKTEHVTLESDAGIVQDGLRFVRLQVRQL